MQGEWSPFRAYAGRVSFFCWQNWLTLLVFLFIFCWLYFSSRHLPAYDWNWDACLDFLAIRLPDGRWKAGLLLQGLFTTLRVGFWTFLFSLFAGALTGFCAPQKSAWHRFAYQGFINLIRNTPPLILLFCVYFIVGNLLPVSKIDDAIRQMPDIFKTAFYCLVAPAGQTDKMLAAVLALGIYQAAYIAEIYRGSLESVPSGQWDAGYALGFGRWQIMLDIILPQGLRLALPALTGQCISTFKESALASLISLPDLTFESLEIMATSAMTFEIWICSAILYLLLGFLCAITGRWLERHYSAHIF